MQKVETSPPKSGSLERQTTPVGENLIKIKIIRKVIGADGKETVTEEKRVEPMPAELVDPAKPRVIKRTIYIVVRPDGAEEVTQEDVDEHAEGGKPSIFSRLRKIISKAIGPDGKEHISEEDAHFPEAYVSQDSLKKRPEEWVRRVKLIRKTRGADGSETTTEEDVEDSDEAMPKGAKKKVTKVVYVVVLPDGNEQVLETDLEETKPGKFRVIRRVVRTIVIKDGQRQVSDEKELEAPSQDEKPSPLDKILDALQTAFAAKPEDRPDLRPPTAEFIQVEKSFWDERPDPKVAVVPVPVPVPVPSTPQPEKDKKSKKLKEKEKTPEPKTPDTKAKDPKEKKQKEKHPVEEVSVVCAWLKCKRASVFRDSTVT